MFVRRRRFRSAGEVFARVGRFLQSVLPMRVPEDIAHLRQAARVEHMRIRSGRLAIPVTMLTGSKACASDDPPPPVTAGHASGPMMAMVFDLGCIERQNVAFVLEQRDAFERALQARRRDRRRNRWDRQDRTAGDRSSHSAARCARCAAPCRQWSIPSPCRLFTAGKRSCAFIKRGEGISRSRPLFAAATPS